MSKNRNPYPEFLIDEASGIKVRDVRHQLWAEGYKAAEQDGQVIKAVFKWEDGTVMVFDVEGKQIRKYQGQYEEVKTEILRDAPPEAVFVHWFDCETDITTVSREEW